MLTYLPDSGTSGNRVPDIAVCSRRIGPFGGSASNCRTRVAARNRRGKRERIRKAQRKVDCPFRVAPTSLAGETPARFPGLHKSRSDLSRPQRNPVVVRLERKRLAGLRTRNVTSTSFGRGEASSKREPDPTTGLIRKKAPPLIRGNDVARFALRMPIDGSPAPEIRRESGLRLKPGPCRRPCNDLRARA